MTDRSNDTNPARHSRRNRLQRERVHDPYRSKRKLKEPTVCPDCGAIYHSGRWQWGIQPTGADQHLCPACLRAQEKVPAGFITLHGKFLKDHVNEILQLARNVEAREKKAHPLKRILDVHEHDDCVRITTTEPNLARGIGEAIHYAYQGQLDYQYTKESYILRVSWTRNS